MIPELEAPAFLRQRQSEMQAAAPYWGLGFRRGALSPAVHARLLDHLQINADRFRAEGKIEEIGNADRGTIPSLIYEDKEFNAQLALDLRPEHEAWAGMRLAVSYCYGIRVYQRGTFLYIHVDRSTHVISSAICIDSRLDSRWPLHLETVDGTVSQIDLAPGELVFYEGTRLAHGRPYPLQGDYYAAIFVHYHPVAPTRSVP